MDDRKSISGFVFTYNRGAVPSRVSLLIPFIELVVLLFYDNNGAIALAKELRSHQKSKHIERRYYIIRELVGKGDVIVQKVASADNVADPLTKAMTQLQLDGHLEKMGLRYCSDWL